MAEIDDEEFKKLCAMQDRDAEEVRVMDRVSKQWVVIAVIMLALLAIAGWFGR